MIKKNIIITIELTVCFNFHIIYIYMYIFFLQYYPHYYNVFFNSLLL